MSVKSTIRRQRRIDSLMRQQRGICYWCSTPMTARLKKPPFPLTMATIDHLRCKFNPTRHVPPKNQEQRWVLACWECNNERARAMQASQPIAVLRDRAGRHPQPLEHRAQK